MPANKKYLTKSPWMRLNKILAGTIGGYTTAMSFHFFLTYLFPKPEVIATAFFSAYILWAFLLLWAFTATNIWKVWLVYALATCLFMLPYILKLNPVYGQ